MKWNAARAFKLAAIALALVVAAGLAAPYVRADQYGERLRGALQRALGRRVEFGGKVRFSLFRGGFSVEDVVIHEDPSIGLEPIAYMDEIVVRPALLPLLAGRFAIASIRLDGASINLAKSGPAEAWGRWNFASLIDRSVMSSTPAVHVRNSRINFKFGEEKSVFYLTETDLDISPPTSSGRGWKIELSAKPARTDGAARGLGSFTLAGRWYVAPERVDLDLDLDRSGLAEITTAIAGQPGGIHGTVSGSLHLAGPLQQIGILGRMRIEDVHRWDLMPPQGEGWPLSIRGAIDLVGQKIELESSTSGRGVPPLWVRFRASDYLSQPHWAVAVNWNRFPLGPLLQLAEHMGAPVPPKLGLSGWMDGAIGYSGRGSLQGTLGFHDAAVTMPDSTPIRMQQAYVVLGNSHAHLTPASAVTASGDRGTLEADYGLDDGALDLTIASDAMPVAALRSQVALAAVPWLEQLASGQWSGRLHYHREISQAAPQAASQAAWAGDLDVKGAQITLPGLADPVELIAAHASIDGARLLVDRIDARAGKLAFGGEYRYEPGASRPHRLRLRAADWRAAELERELAPTLRHGPGLIARALGRAALPDWLRHRALEGTIEIGRLDLAGLTLSGLRARLVWDASRVALDNFQAKFAGAPITGTILANLAGPSPAYRFAAHVKGLAWQSGKLDADGTLETAGTGSQLLTNLKADGSFAGAALDFGQGPWRHSSGIFSLSWSPAGPTLTNLSLQAEDETYTGHGNVQDDGRLLVILSNGTREMRIVGPLAKLHVDEAVR
ncbi:MAG: hypothetical protein ACLQVN_08305 [Bryobacteraceae bacterium]